MEELIKLLVDNGISAVCVGFLMYYILVVSRDEKKVLEKMIDSINDMNSTLISVCAIMGIKEDIEKIYKEIVKGNDSDKVMFITGIYPTGKKVYYAVDLSE